MNDQDKTRDEILEELRALRDRVAPPEGVGAELPAWIGQILETIDDALLVLDREWRFRYVNRHALRHAGAPLAELLGRSIWEKYPQLLGTPLEAHYRRAMAQQTPAHFEMPGLLTGRWLEVHAYPSPDALVVYSRDVSDRRRAEQALRESEERLSRFMEAACEGIAIHDGTTILDANPALADLFGYPPAEIVGKRVLDLAAPPSRDEIRRRIQSGDEAVYEATGLRKDGSTFPGEVCAKGITYRGRPARVTAVRNISERKRAQEELQESAGRLQALSRRLLEVQEEERRRLARELHDEVAQVLTGLHYILEMARRADGPPRDASLAEAQALVQELARQVRDTSQLLRPSMLDDLGLGPALVWLCERCSAQTGVQVAFEPEGLEGRLPARVETVAYRTVQEALTNAARHAATDRAVVRVRAEPGWLHVRVEDPGAGFDPGRLRQAPAGGGLSLIRERVDLLGGRLAVESAPGAGTRLTASFPIGDSEETGHGDVDAAVGR